MPGTVYTVRATCVGLTATTILDAVCADGTDPINGVCADPGASTTTTISGGTPAGGTGTSTGTNTIAFTGAGRAVQLLQVGASLVGLGIFLMLFTRRHRDPVEARI